MKHDVIVNNIVEVIKEILGDSSEDNNFILSEDMKLFQAGLGLSSIDGVMLIVKLEERFAIQWPDELLTFKDVLTVGQVADVIGQILEQKEN